MHRTDLLYLCSKRHTVERSSCYRGLGQERRQRGEKDQHKLREARISFYYCYH